MIIPNINPTRMALTKLRSDLKTARKGHKLLKDKRDELMRRFLDLVRMAKRQHGEVEEMLVRSSNAFSAAAAVMGREEVMAALLIPRQKLALEIETKNIMSVEIPGFKIHEQNRGGIIPYGYAFTSSELDYAVNDLYDIRGELLRLAETEKAIQCMAAEIEKTRRRVNALEYVLIPNYEDTIRYITMKLDESERSNLSRLMKVKDMMIEQRINESKRNNVK